MELSIREVDRFKIIEMPGMLDDSAADDLRKNLFVLVDRGCRHMVIDLTKVVHLSSHAIGVFVVLWKKMTEKGDSFEIIAGDSSIRDIFNSVNLHTLIRIYASENEFRSFLTEWESIISKAHIREIGKYKVLDVDEPLNIFCGHKELDQIMTELFNKGNRYVALNLTPIIHMYSEVIGVLVKWIQKMEEAGGKFYVLNLAKDLRERLFYLELHGVIRYCKSESDLLQL